DDDVLMAANENGLDLTRCCLVKLLLSFIADNLLDIGQRLDTGHYPILFRGVNGTVALEFIVDLRPLKIFEDSRKELFMCKGSDNDECFDKMEENYMTYKKKLDEVMIGRARTGWAVILIWRGSGTLCIDDGVIGHNYFPKPRAKAYLDNFEIDEEDHWLCFFEVGRDKDRNPMYSPVTRSFLDIEDKMERALAMEAYFNPFKNIIIFKKLVDFLGSLPVQLKNTDWGNEGYGMYKKI
ncbi:hypothetical protein Tco_0603661, partial [Tanacetum coccineum]